MNDRKKLKEIRRYIRKAIRWYRVDDGMPTHWSSLYYKMAKRMKGKTLAKDEQHYHYYTRSSRAIEDIAMKILDVIKR